MTVVSHAGPEDGPRALGLRAQIAIDSRFPALSWI